MRDQLTIKERKLLNYYLRTGKLAESARRAGYSGNDHVLGVTAHQVLRRTRVRAEVQRRIDECEVSAREVIGVLAQVVRSGPGDLIDEESGNLMSLKEMRDVGVDGLVKEIHVKRVLEPAGGFGEDEKVPVEITRVKMYDRLAAARQLSKIMGIEQAPMVNRNDQTRQIKLLAHAMKKALAIAAETGDQVSVNEVWEWLVAQERTIFHEDVAELRDEVFAAAGLVETNPVEPGSRGSPDFRR